MPSTSRPSGSRQAARPETSRSDSQADERHHAAPLRKPSFQEWSNAAQPERYPDEIVWKLGVNADAAVTAIERGRADWIANFPPLPPNRLPERETQYANQLHVNTQLGTPYMNLNVREPPFNDVRVRQALNYAIDRAALVHPYGGTKTAAPSCQILPPRVPGYERYCPYTIGPPAGTWKAPDLARARRLVAASGTRGMRVRFWGTPNPGHDRTEGLAVVATLRRLGYRAAYRNLPDDAVERVINNPRNHVQIFGNGWVADYPAASDFIEVKLSCRSFPRSRTADAFCAPAIDRQVKQAERLQLDDPQKANALWARIDRELVDRAVWLP